MINRFSLRDYYQAHERIAILFYFMNVFVEYKCHGGGTLCCTSNKRYACEPIAERDTSSVCQLYDVIGCALDFM